MAPCSSRNELMVVSSLPPSLDGGGGGGETRPSQSHANRHHLVVRLFRLVRTHFKSIRFSSRQSSNTGKSVKLPAIHYETKEDPLQTINDDDEEEEEVVDTNTTWPLQSTSLASSSTASSIFSYSSQNSPSHSPEEEDETSSDRDEDEHSSTDSSIDPVEWPSSTTGTLNKQPRSLLHKLFKRTPKMHHAHKTSNYDYYDDVFRPAHTLAATGAQRAQRQRSLQQQQQSNVKFTVTEKELTYLNHKIVSSRLMVFVCSSMIAQ